MEAVKKDMTIVNLIEMAKRSHVANPKVCGTCFVVVDDDESTQNFF